MGRSSPLTFDLTTENTEDTEMKMQKWQFWISPVFSVVSVVNPQVDCHIGLVPAIIS